MKTLQLMEYTATPVLLFVNECCVLQDDLKKSERLLPTDRVRCDGSLAVMKDELYAAWRVWNEARGTQAGVKEQFARHMLNTFPAVKASRLRTSKEDDKKLSVDASDRQYYYLGIDLTDEARNRYIV
jgi:phage/plasmid-associated DNA primase